MGNNPVSGVDPDGGWIFTKVLEAASRFVSNLNAFFSDRFGIDSGFSVEKVEVEHKGYANFIDWIKGKETVISVETYYKITANELCTEGLNKEDKFLVESFQKILTAPTAIEAMLTPRGYSEGFARGGQVDKGDGHTYGPQRFAVPSILPDYPSAPNNKNIASQILHESLWHISPYGKFKFENKSYSSDLYRLLRVKSFGGPYDKLHTGGNFLNPRIKNP
jgi:hypothetical protein